MQDSVKWLEEFEYPNEDLITHWNITANYQSDWIKKSNSGVADIITAWPVLKNPTVGIKLILEDFNNLGLITGNPISK